VLPTDLFLFVMNKNLNTNNNTLDPILVSLTPLAYTIDGDDTTRDLNN